MKKLIIMRGVPGSGKSTKAKTLVAEGIIHSTDDLIEATGDYAGHFARMVESGNWSAHGKMHHQNFLNAKKSMEEGITPVIVDNTNIKANEAKKYVKSAIDLGYEVVIEDVGSGGCTAEVLTERNSHNVQLETIERMMASHKGVGELTVKKILESKDMYKKKKFASVVLDEASRTKLLKAIGHSLPLGWDVIAHHMTINFGEGLGRSRELQLGDKVRLEAISIGISDMAFAVGVRSLDISSDNEMPHITVGVNRAEGGKPVMSNNIKKWSNLEPYIGLTGIVTEQTL